MRWPFMIAFMGAALALTAQDGTPAEKPSRAWRMRGQFAGYQGLISVGGGPVLAKGLWRPALMYGFAPADSYRTAVHQIILRNDLVFLRKGREAPWHVSPTASLNVLLETGRHSYLSLPERFPRGYYMAPLPRVTLGAGARLARGMSSSGPFREWAFTGELVALDSYLWYAVSERGFPLADAIGLSFGAELLF